MLSHVYVLLFIVDLEVKRVVVSDQVLGLERVARLGERRVLVLEFGTDLLPACVHGLSVIFILAHLILLAISGSHL
jgi:hypothetical protein